MIWSNSIVTIPPTTPSFPICARRLQKSFRSKRVLASTSLMMASSARQCGARWISAPGGPTSILAWPATNCARRRRRRSVAPGPSAVRNARSLLNSTPLRRAPPQGGTSTARLYGLTCTAPVKYTGQAAIQRDIQNLKSALTGAQIEEAFMIAVSPATLQILPNAYYKDCEEYTWALAEAIREEYRAIVVARFILQIDDPALVHIYDWWFSMNDDIAGFRKWAAFQVEAVNHALEGIPEDRVRFHICWGSWHGPHKG